jgi:hypothetical protein
LEWVYAFPQSRDDEREEEMRMMANELIQRIAETTDLLREVCDDRGIDVFDGGIVTEQGASSLLGNDLGADRLAGRSTPPFVGRGVAGVIPCYRLRRSGDVD